MPTAVDAVLFDLDDTICAYRRPRDEVLSVAFDRTGVEPFFSIEDYYAVWNDHTVPGEGKDAQIEASFVALAEKRGVHADIGRRVARAYADERDHRNVACLPGAREALAELADTYRIGLVTNGAPDMQATKLGALGLGDVFETLVHGGHDAPSKPAPEPFHLALDDLGVDPGRAVYVGDSLESDVAGAHAAGIASIWVAPDDGADPDPRPDYSVSSLQQLVPPPWK